MPRLPGIAGAEQGRVFYARVHSVRIAKRRFQVPHAFELPRMLRAVVPLVSGEGLSGFRRGVVYELVARALGHAAGGYCRTASRRLPRLTAVVRALNHLPKPSAGL